MKLILSSIWVLAIMALGFTGIVSWTLAAGLSVLPVFFIGKPWYSSFTGETAERK